MNVDYDYASITEERITRAVLYDRRRKTYIHEVDILYNTSEETCGAPSQIVKSNISILTLSLKYPNRKTL